MGPGGRLVTAIWAASVVRAAVVLAQGAAAADDYETITMMNMRRAAEKQRLIEQMEREDANEE